VTSKAQTVPVLAYVPRRGGTVPHILNLQHWSPSRLGLVTSGWEPPVPIV
jgi:hypothetical protein